MPVHKETVHVSTHMKMSSSNALANTAKSVGKRYNQLVAPPVIQNVRTYRYDNIELEKLRNRVTVELGYAPWDVRSTELMPRFAEAATELRELKSGVLMSKVDAERYKNKGCKLLMMNRKTLIFNTNDKDESFSNSHQFSNLVTENFDFNTMIKTKVSQISHQFSNLVTVSQWNYAIKEAVNQSQYQNALILFRQMTQKRVQPNHLTFPIIAKACGKLGLVQLGDVDKVLSLFKQMRVEGIQPDSLTVIGISQSIMGREGVRLVKAVHSFGIRIGIEVDVSVSNTWVSSYAKVRDLDSAEKLFREIDPRFVTVVSWNSIIAGYGYFNRYSKAISFYKKMLYDGFRPDLSTNLNLLSSISQHEALFAGKLIHCHGIKTGCDSDITILNTLISMYSKCDDLNAARLIFDSMMNKTCVSWTAMIGGYAEKGDLDVALALFDSMEATGLKPDLVTILNLIAGCGETGALEIGRWVEKYAVLNGLKNNLMVLNALIDMYAKCGSLKEAREIFCKMREKTVVSWTSMISGCALNGEFEEALTYFYRMLELGIRPNHITFLAVFQACNHGGFIKKGWEVYNLMTKVYKITPGLDHYSSMADLLARGGKINDALEFIRKMPIKPDVGIWSSLLSACKIHHNVEIGEFAAYNLFEMDPRAAAPYVEMANIYASEGRWDGVMDVRRLMKRNQVVKYPGQSVIQIRGKSYKFTVEDRCHPNGSVIYEVLDYNFKQSKSKQRLLQLILILIFVLSVSGIYRYSPMHPCTTKLPITVNGGLQQVASSTISSYQDGIKEEPCDVECFGAPPNSARNRQYQHNVNGSTFHMDLNNVNQDVVELSSDSENEDNPSCDDSDKQLVLYDPSVHGGGEIECCPDPISYQPASHQPISYQPPYISRNNFRNQLQSVLPAIGAYTVQCANCFKWRLVPTQEKYEEIREHITQYPFVCERALEWGSDVSCDDPPDIEQDGSRLWAIDKPNIAQTPPGWQRDLRIRSEGSTKFGDIYYTSPTGVTLRSKPEVEKYLFQHPEYMEQGVSLAQFSFRTPKPLQENYVRKRPSRAAAIQDGNFMGMPGSVEPLSGGINGAIVIVLLGNEYGKESYYRLYIPDLFS
ncbi:Pentatricopeptide repeat-containing protein [Artemisia annua]|uniref:Pentatricopeptide repeat-containing protein n=1 Tax=Artemisia annua TaxID=35608 RepID=A0A2U1MWY7_ARTAN|nr:Pentatricopeptide repeat-containing protein [Artemisia annua]